MSEKLSVNDSLFSSLMRATIPVIAKSGGKFTIGIVNNANGKRITLCKALVEYLGVDDKVCAMPAAEARKLVLGKSLPFQNAVELTLHGEGKKTAYVASFVEVVTELFSLDFSTRTSCTFGDVTFDELEGVPVAIVTFPE